MTVHIFPIESLSTSTLVDIEKVRLGIIQYLKMQNSKGDIEAYHLPETKKM